MVGNRCSLHLFSSHFRVDHRENCAKDHERFLTGMTKSVIRCPRCSARFVNSTKRQLVIVKKTFIFVHIFIVIMVSKLNRFKSMFTKNSYN